ncbi:MAG: hypothetical protein WBM07_11270 [Chitinivibrionales bacterium]
MNPTVCAFPEACFGFRKRLYDSPSIGMEDASQLAAGSSLLCSRKVKAVRVHHLVPGRYEIPHELLLRVVTCIDFRERTELGI